MEFRRQLCKLVHQADMVSGLCAEPSLYTKTSSGCLKNQTISSPEAPQNSNCQTEFRQKMCKETMFWYGEEWKHNTAYMSGQKIVDAIELEYNSL